MFPSASPRGTLRVSGKQNSLFPLGPVIKCLLLHAVCFAENDNCDARAARIFNSFNQ